MSPSAIEEGVPASPEVVALVKIAGAKKLAAILYFTGSATNAKSSSGFAVTDRHLWLIRTNQKSSADFAATGVGVGTTGGRQASARPSAAPGP
jgi:hypothetical protein